MGHINTQNAHRVLDKAHEMCADIFGSNAAQQRACVKGVNTVFYDLVDSEGITYDRTSMKGLSGAELGIFQPCMAPCPKGYEKLVLKKGNPSKDQRGVCVCRLDPYHRKKFKGEKYAVAEDKRKPFGTWKKPMHLRRLNRQFAPGIRARDLTTLTR